jgi:hypothetical protein
MNKGLFLPFSSVFLYVLSLRRLSGVCGLCFFLPPAFAQTAQVFERFHAPVEVEGKTLTLPFAGGLNAPQFSPADLNQDGIQDLVVFDRGGDILLTFLNDGTPNQSVYHFAPEYACHFPVLRDYMLMRDFNRDGAADIFCASLAPLSQEIQVFQGYFEGKALKFKPFTFTYPSSCTICNPYQIFFPDNDQPGFWNNLAVSRADIPAIDDIDGDGDLDILTFAASVGGHIWFLKNTSVESGFGLDSLRFRLADECWGRFYESGFVACKNDLSPDPNACPFQFARGPQNGDLDARHPGSTIMTYDQEGDGDKEIVLGDISFSCFNMMINGGTPEKAYMIQQDTLFPSNDVSVNILSFPAPFYLDVNNDGKKDMIATVNAGSVGEDRKGVWFYENRGSNINHRFELETRTFLVGDMIDIGSISHPAFADVDADGLTDLIVGNYGYFNASGGTNASLYLFKNIGTPTEPSFQLTDRNWLNFAQYAPNDYDFAPAFGDIDSDGDTDMLVGSNLGGLFCYINQAGAGNPLRLERDFNLMWLTMDVGQTSVPFITDLDKDGLQDVIIGERLGNVNFYKNTGIVGQPKFTPAPTIDRLGAVDARLPGESLGHSTPALIETPDGTLLVMGTASGQMEAYSDIKATAQPFPVVSERWANNDEGARTHPAFADLNGDGLLEMAVGNYRGGLSLFKTRLKDCLTSSSVLPSPAVSNLKVSPNPATRWVRATLPASQTADWCMVNTMGQTVLAGHTAAGSGLLHCDVSTLPPGVYYLEVQQEGKRLMAKVAVR